VRRWPPPLYSTGAAPYGDVAMNDQSALATLTAELAALMGDRVSTSAALRAQHGRGESWVPAAPPDVAGYPLTTDEVVATVKLCAKHRIPIVPFGAGTSLEGQVVAVKGGVCVDFSRMNRIVAVNPADLDCVIEPGVTRKQLNAHLRDAGLF